MLTQIVNVSIVKIISHLLSARKQNLDYDF